MESLLAYADNSTAFLEEQRDAVAAELFGPADKQTLIGKSIGHYRIHSIVGSGGMGEVYVAEDTKLKRTVAIKLLPKQYAEEPGRIRRFEQEARLISALSHPNIITIHEIGEFERKPYLVAEYVEGASLREELANGPRRPQVAVQIALQTALALSAAHQAGIIHRDIKPENIIVRPDGLVKVLDFGLAKWTEERSAVHGVKDLLGCSTTAGLIVGTPRYMSPEQARGVPLDFRTDLFSLGSVLYEMLSGRAAMTGDTPSDILASVLARDPEPLENLCSECPAALVRIVNRALQKNLHKRYQSAEEMATDLNIVLRGLESGISWLPPQTKFGLILTQRRNRFQGPNVPLCRQR